MKNREIKFRVWDSRSNGFVVNEEAEYTSFTNRSIYFDLWDWVAQMGTCLTYPVDDYVFQQFAGLTDSKGKEIYEGDIVINSTPDEEYCSPALVIWAKYDELSYGLAYNYKGVMADHLKPLLHTINDIQLIEEFRLSRFGIYEVIGNVFENKDLLK